MISLEKTRQDLQSLNMTTIVLNFIFATFGLLGLVGIIFGMAMMGNPDFQAGLADGAGTSPEQLQMVQGVFGTIGIVIMVVATIFPLIVAILALLNRKKIAANQPSLVPYYIGGVVAVFNLIGGQVNGFNLIGLAIQGGLIVLYYFAIKKSKDLLNNSKTDSIIED